LAAARGVIIRDDVPVVLTFPSCSLRMLPGAETGVETAMWTPSRAAMLPSDEIDCVVSLVAGPDDLAAEAAANSTLPVRAGSDAAADQAISPAAMLVLLSPLYVVLAVVGGPEAVLAVFGGAALFAIVTGICVRLWFDRPATPNAVADASGSRLRPGKQFVASGLKIALDPVRLDLAQQASHIRALRHTERH
jgi:hypothetical protein